jgi:hypothetical protein
LCSGSLSLSYILAKMPDNTSMANAVFFIGETLAQI